MGGWSSKNHWVKRANEWDDAMNRWELRQIQKGKIEARRRRIKQQMLRQQIGRKRLQAIPTEGAEKDFKDELSADSALKLIDSGEKGERMEYGEVDEALNISGNTHVALSVEKGGAGVESIEIKINQKAMLKEKFLEASPEEQQEFIRSLRKIVGIEETGFEEFTKDDGEGRPLTP